MVKAFGHSTRPPKGHVVEVPVSNFAIWNGYLFAASCLVIAAMGLFVAGPGLLAIWGDAPQDWLKVGPGVVLVALGAFFGIREGLESWRKHLLIAGFRLPIIRIDERGIEVPAILLEGPIFKTVFAAGKWSHLIPWEEIAEVHEHLSANGQAFLVIAGKEGRPNISASRANVSPEAVLRAVGDFAPRKVGLRR